MRQSHNLPPQSQHKLLIVSAAVQQGLSKAACLGTAPAASCLMGAHVHQVSPVAADRLPCRTDACCLYNTPMAASACSAWLLKVGPSSAALLKHPAWHHKRLAAAEGWHLLPQLELGLQLVPQVLLPPLTVSVWQEVCAHRGVLAHALGCRLCSRGGSHFCSFCCCASCWRLSFLHIHADRPARGPQTPLVHAAGQQEPKSAQDNQQKLLPCQQKPPYASQRCACCRWLRRHPLCSLLAKQESTCPPSASSSPSANDSLAAWFARAFLRRCSSRACKLQLT